MSFSYDESREIEFYSTLDLIMPTSFIHTLYKD